MNKIHINYLNDTIKLLIKEAKQTENDNEFNSGIRLGYYHAISRILSQSIAFGFFEELDYEIREFNLESLL